MKKVRISIPFEDNKDRSILTALKAICSYSDLTLEAIAPQLRQFHEGHDIHCDITTLELDTLINILKHHGFMLKVSW
ncbi:hypothetical protein [Taibaiella chishuiensis]|uniref:Uncharacterized protein n=1 Tax=Taibaiella chishuiensis TaxID=1434707 RepID=A0A2P8D7A0_9BACT|nr:hypothetical protein [Taibaiella chishuiensis]PSK93104.1 hypothetical protein B0I18_10273 [Taibaiella chishuiensis]